MAYYVVQTSILLVLFSITTLIIAQSGEENWDLCKKECNDTKYELYRECILARLENGGCKDYEKACSECDCNFCMTNSCQPICKNCCVQNSCTTPQCCYKTCHSTCNSTSCRSQCKKTCSTNMIEDIPETTKEKYVDDNWVGETAPENLTVSENSTVPENLTLPENSTTIINVHTIINNTNIIELPVDSDNSNNGGNVNCSKSVEIYRIKEKEPCCQVITPRQCTATPQYPFTRCFHYRKHVCGPFCKAPIVHQESNENCEETPDGVNCQKILVFIPQPQPNCAYQPFWPYVTCGVQPQFCGGCYSHYKLPFQPPACPFGCYDDGYSTGPLYRHGPFYRPGFAHSPSCIQLGTCNPDVLVEDALPPNLNVFGGCGYPSTTYEDDLHIEPDSENVDDEKPIKQRENQPETSESVLNPYYAFPVIPYYNLFRYPVRPFKTPYKIQPEVNIHAIITRPEQSRRYAQITISKLAGNGDNTTEGDVNKSSDTSSNAISQND